MTDPTTTNPTDIDAAEAAKASQAVGIADENAAYVNADETAAAPAKDGDEAEAHPS